METIAQLNRALSARYCIEREIGSGGMATVFAAEDVRHGRHVALKVLKPELAAVLGVDRFLAEIRVTATLQHPNLVPLFDSGDADGMLFYVMPLLEGESLRARLDRERQLPVEEAVRIGSAVAAALDYAHARGVIHRDLKPENILLQAGEPMVADFGIALAVSVAGGQRVTQTGLSLGTPQYMSPEQATGDRHIDARTDIYSLGAVIYEMLTGEPPHIGGTVRAIIARVINEPAKSVRETRPLVPEHVSLAVDKALEKVPADRWSTGRDLADALHGRLRISAPASATTSVESQRRSWALRHALAVALAIVGISVGAIATAFALRDRVSDDPTVEFSIASANGLTVLPVSVAVSPDGRTLAFTAQGQKPTREVFVRALNDPTIRVIEGSENATQPAFSPDGRWIVFWSILRRKIVRAPVAGGPASDVADITRMGRLTWTRDDRLVFTTGGSLATVSANGGTVAIVSRPDSASGEVQMQNALLIDDGRAVVYASIPRSAVISDAELAVTGTAGGPHARLGLKGILPLQVLGGMLFYVRGDGVLMAVQFDAGHRRVTGQPVPIRKGLSVRGNSVTAALSPNGTLLFMKLNEERELVWVDERGNARAAIADRRTYLLPRISPDGKRIVVYGGRPNSRSGQHWILDIASGTLAPLSSDTTAYYGEWSADGRAVLFWRSADTSITWQPADASGPPSRVLADGKFHYFAAHPNGKQLVYTAFPDIPNSDGHLRVRNIAGDTTSHPLEGFPGGEWAYRFSPDGRWLAYVSNESGGDEVYARPFPGPGARTQVSQGGGTEPVWAPDGARIYYRDAAMRVMYSADVRASGTAFQVLRRTKLFEGDFGVEWDVADYDVSHGPTRELLMTRAPGGEKQELVVVVGLQQELRRRLQTP